MRERQFAHCAVCRRNHDQGKKHRYSAGHKKALEQVLSKAQAKMEIIRKAMEQPCPPSEGGYSFWCWFCQVDIVDNQNEALFAWSNGIYHLASSKHEANMKKFWLEHGADAKRKHEFCFSKKELQKWEALCNENPPNSLREGDPGGEDNIHIAGNSSFSMISCVSSSVEPLLEHKLQKPAEGNVHSGAPPPWMVGMSKDDVHESCGSQPTSKRKEREAKRLDKRVGAAWAKKRRAELEREKSCGKSCHESDGNWLPSFGGVWQNGTRRENRKEFAAQNATMNAGSTTVPPVQPYVGKRKQMQDHVANQNV